MQTDASKSWLIKFWVGLFLKKFRSMLRRLACFFLRFVTKHFKPDFTSCPALILEWSPFSEVTESGFVLLELPRLLRFLLNPLFFTDFTVCAKNIFFLNSLIDWNACGNFLFLFDLAGCLSFGLGSLKIPQLSFVIQKASNTTCAKIVKLCINSLI